MIHAIIFCFIFLEVQFVSQRSMFLNPDDFCAWTRPEGKHRTVFGLILGSAETYSANIDPGDQVV